MKSIHISLITFIAGLGVALAQTATESPLLSHPQAEGAFPTLEWGVQNCAAVGHTQQPPYFDNCEYFIRKEIDDGVFQDYLKILPDGKLQQQTIEDDGSITLTKTATMNPDELHYDLHDQNGDGTNSTLNSFNLNFNLLGSAPKSAAYSISGLTLSQFDKSIAIDQTSFVLEDTLIAGEPGNETTTLKSTSIEGTEININNLVEIGASASSNSATLNENSLAFSHSPSGGMTTVGINGITTIMPTSVFEYSSLSGSSLTMYGQTGSSDEFDANVGVSEDGISYTLTPAGETNIEAHTSIDANGITSNQLLAHEPGGSDFLHIIPGGWGLERADEKAYVSGSTLYLQGRTGATNQHVGEIALNQDGLSFSLKEGTVEDPVWSSTYINYEGVHTPALHASVIVSTPEWEVIPDFVFEKDYELRSLEDTERFVKKNKHLPDIPSAKEISEKGMNLTDMNLKLLKTVEELTLHVIDLDKKLKEQEKRNDALVREVSALQRVERGNR